MPGLGFFIFFKILLFYVDFDYSTMCSSRIPFSKGIKWTLSVG